MGALCSSSGPVWQDWKFENKNLHSLLHPAEVCAEPYGNWESQQVLLLHALHATKSSWRWRWHSCPRHISSRTPVCDFDLELDDYENLADKLVKDEGLPEDEREKIKEFLEEKVPQRKIELEQVHLTEIFNYFPRDLTFYKYSIFPKTCASWRSQEESYWRYGP